MFGSCVDYNALSDEELVCRAKNGDDGAMAALISRLEPIANARAAAKSVSSPEPEDLAQEGMIGFLSAVRTYDSSKGASFRTYASFCIENRIISAIRSFSKKRSVPGSSVVSLESGSVDLADNRFDPQDIFLLRESELNFSRGLKKTLSDFEQKVARLYIDGHSYKEIAKILGVSEKSVDNAMQRVKKKLKS